MTLIADTFDRADSTTGLGTASDGGSWTENATWGIASNKAQRVSAAASMTAVRTSVADGFVQVTVSGSGGFWVGLVFRYVDASNYWRVRCSSGGAFSKLEKVVSGVSTQIGSNFTMADGDVLRAEATGTSIAAKINGATVVSGTDSAMQTATLVGLYGDGANTATARWDNFTAGTIVAPPAYIAPRVRVGRFAPLMRSVTV